MNDAITPVSVRTYPRVSPDVGVMRQVLAENPALMVVAFDFEAGTLVDTFALRRDDFL